MQAGRRTAAFLHRTIWQNLPLRLRRQALVQASALLAPRPDGDCAAAEPIFVVGALRTASGLGQSARLCLQALRQLGHATYGIDVSQLQMQTLDLPGPAPAGDRRHRGPGTVILHVNAPFIPLALTALGRRFLKGKRIVGYWAWELPRVPEEWRLGVPLVHEIWVPSRFTAAAVQPLAGERPVHVIPHPIACAAGAAPARVQPGLFRVLTVFNCGSGFVRKNPVAAIRAFRQAFGEKAAAELVVKSSNLASYPQARRELEEAIGGQRNIRHLDQTGTPEQVEELYAAADAVLSLHRSEGFGLVPAEAMLHGLPVVATGWSGNLDFMADDNACLVNFSLIPAVDPQRLYHAPDQCWADPDVAHAAEWLRRLQADPDLRLRIGAAAGSSASHQFSIQTFGAHANKALQLKP